MSGTWDVLANPPGFQTSTMLLLTDGRVICQGDGTANWSALSPDSGGSYRNGTWAPIAPMSIWRRYYASAVLASGKVFVAGGEDAPTSDTNVCEIYDPVADTWTVMLMTDSCALVPERTGSRLPADMALGCRRPVAGRASDVSVEIGEDFEATVDIRRLQTEQPTRCRARRCALEVARTLRCRSFSETAALLIEGETILPSGNQELRFITPPRNCDIHHTSSFLGSVGLPRRRLGDIGAVPRFHLLRGRML